MKAITSASTAFFKNLFHYNLHHRGLLLTSSFQNNFNFRFLLSKDNKTFQRIINKTSAGNSINFTSSTTIADYNKNNINNDKNNNLTKDSKYESLDRKYPVPNFRNTEAIYRGKSNSELLRTMLVFGLCSVDYLVDNQTKILKLTRNIFGKKLFALLMEWTFFGQFMVREEEGKILEGLRKLNERGISPMLAYTAPELHGSVDGDGASNEPAKEQWYLDNFNSVLKSFHIAAKCYSFTKTRPIITTKVTFFVDHSLLVLLSSLVQQQNALLLHNNRLVDSFISKNPTWNTRSKESLKNDLIFHVELNKMIHSVRNENHSPTRGNEGVVKLQDAHLNLFEKLRERMDKLCLTAQQNNLSLNFDAEQTYLQTAIEMLCIHFQRLYNERAPVVLNTYQCYLKRTGDVIENHVTLAKQDGFCFGGKIVRGAYIDEERRLAKEKQTVDPVNPTYAATTSMYQRVSEFLINQVKCQGEGRMRVIFATHNEDSVTDVLNRLREKEINMDGGDVSFAQLYGTRDFISYTLGSLGYPVSKMVHYSNPVDGLAYLSRRLTENRSGLASPEIERRLPVVELKRRLFGRRKNI